MKMRISAILVLILIALVPSKLKADNPIVQTNYTADPAPMVHNGTVYLYTTHDEDKTVRNFFTMNDWKCYSSTDMVNWTDHGTILSYKDFSWSRGDAWAGQCVYRNGKFYFYVPMNMKNGGNAIGVAVSDSPTGPFKDALGKPLLVGYGYIDPTVFIDDDGQAYLYWGNPHLWYVKLNKDMLSYDEKAGIVQVPLTDESFKLRTINAHKTFSWASSIDGRASHSIKGPNNKYYWFVSAVDKATNKQVIGLGVGTQAIGPFEDVLGKPFITEHCGDGNINPTVIIDNEKQPFLVWGESELWSVKLNADWISYDSTKGAELIPADKKEWFASKIKGTVNSTEKRTTTYEEGPWVFKRNSKYYLLYPAGGVPEHLAYSTGKSVTGPWVYGDTIMRIIPKDGAFTNHPGYIDYKGKSYLFYHNAGLPGGGGFKRSVCIEEFKFNADGSIPVIQPTKVGVNESVTKLNPFARVEAETIAWEEGIETAAQETTGVYVTDIHNGDYIKVRSVDFGKGAKNFQANVATATEGGSIEIHLDSKSGAIIGTLNIKTTGDALKWAVQSAKINRAKGVHDIYFVFKGGEGNLFNFDWWKLN
ncbi:glycoside hydrolase family 43 [Paludibacter propionicigenes WB4]|uniref:Glycoside hydrolase family 43 n=1 Tax=Paludibacter propionicigenes (strain DSM 17365 / JCM 13257 / WB4) TaxID=694427 RepID=E4T4X6_PALPW|nr:family 43 glycosylhydrolase [Paludibacter propionicigenes]ADQ79770.1 glycoside hydrolase family 43 [Paludibacter propionicigenes WB4]